MNLGFKCMSCNALYKGDADGVRNCLFCKGKLRIEVMDDETYGKSPSLLETKQKKKGEVKVTERKSLSIPVDMNTDKKQLKLRAIAKHTAALADELDAIDNTWLCECGSDYYQEEVIHDYKEDAHFIKRTCHKCKTDYAMPLDDDLPTRFEGSE